MIGRALMDAIVRRLTEERIATADRIWTQIERTASTPDTLDDLVGVTWKQLLRIFDRERQP